MDLFTPTNILFLITLATVLVNVYISLKKPQEEGVTNDAVMIQKFEGLCEKLDIIKNNKVKEIFEIGL